jgi:hypothetical protein
MLIRLSAAVWLFLISAAVPTRAEIVLNFPWQRPTSQEASALLLIGAASALEAIAFAERGNRENADRLTRSAVDTISRAIAMFRDLSFSAPERGFDAGRLQSREAQIVRQTFDAYRVTMPASAKQLAEVAIAEATTFLEAVQRSSFAERASARDAALRLGGSVNRLTRVGVAISQLGDLLR